MIRTLLAALVAVILLAQTVRADEAASLRAAIASADRGDWNAALAEAGGGGSLAADVIEWRYLREQPASFAAYVDFLRRRPDWPGLKLLRKKGEAAITDGLSPVLIVSYFADEPPQTGQGSLALAHALRAQGDRKAAAKEAIRAWRNLSMRPEDQAAFLAEFGEVLADHHDGRMAAMLQAGLTTDAKRMLPLASAGTRAVAEARIALQERANGVDALIKAVPDRMKGSAGLAYDRFRWRIGKDLYADAGTLMLERSGSAKELGDPEAWADWRRKLARKEMREGDPRRAYRMAANHHLESGDDYADLEWLSGYIALRKLGDVDTALKHFARYKAAVNGPISLARAGYWLGRAYEAAGRAGDAQAAYAEAARYQTAFYGLLAAENAGLPLSPALLGGEAYPGWQDASFAGSSVFKAGRLLMQAGEHQLAARFFLHLSEGLSGEDIGRIAGMALEADEPYIGVVLAKAAADKGVIWPSAYFPLVGLDHLNLPVPTELTLSIARRESEFNPEAVSSVGALGLMQVMPETGKMMAAKVGVGFDRTKLGSDFDYNATLGSAYLAGLVEEFGTSPLLVATGYNAGPGRSRKWIASLGDPRVKGVDPVDWIEAIPFRETQTYVMRVAESLPIYRARLTGQVGPVDFTGLLKGRW
ncbi:lytic transglycosylase domain-containing protein [Frigidibacter sp. RF13]|uniref:lytic transglycosylase domain-containing protein n=1 Tax=Frigidibacter sp. RF13 TaxID=2997340 RepID=UPI00226DA2DB|nr:lytic transglycosylase domain-containing protein [Frigidibacter sp. RF13]MCY1127629.1 lytic transglycosylase domain-containing protein [Frigidibacter sp. RF13]